MSVDHGCSDVFMSEQFLNRANVVAVLEEMSGERMPEGVAAHTFVKAGFLGGLFHCALEGGFIEVVTALNATARVKRTPGGGKNVLPEEITGSVWVFSLECVREVDFTIALSQVLFMPDAGAFHLTFEVGSDGIGQRGNPVFFPLAIADRDGLVFEVNILDAQAYALHQTQAGTVEQLSHELMCAAQVVDDMKNFLMS